MIVKVQKPISDPIAMWLVYGEGRQPKKLLPLGAIPQPVRDAVAKGQGRAFFNATFEAKGRVIFGPQAEEQPW